MEKKEISKFCQSYLQPIKPQEAEIVILGLPYEGVVNSRPGAVQGPRAVRQASDCIESYSPSLDRDLLSLKVCDGGDVRVRGKGKEALDALADGILERIGKNVRPAFIGGDHSVSYSAVKALSGLGHRFSLIHLDAHTDSQDAFEGDPWSYACWLRRAREMVSGAIYQLGVRTGTKEELDYASRHHKLFLADRFVEGIRLVGEETKGKDVYVSFDIDALDPSLAPGTSNPVYGGLLYDHVQALLHGLRGSNVIGFDLVEVAPNLDPSGRTAIIAGEIIRDAILAWWG